jgi:hypothetical protein
MPLRAVPGSIGYIQLGSGDMIPVKSIDYTNGSFLVKTDTPSKDIMESFKTLRENPATYVIQNFTTPEQDRNEPMYGNSQNKAQTHEQRQDVIEKLLRAWDLQPKQGFAQLLINGVLSGQRNINIIDFAHLEDFDIASRVLAYAQHFQAQERIAPIGPVLQPTASTLRQARQEKVSEDSIEDILKGFIG